MDGHSSGSHKPFVAEMDLRERDSPGKMKTGRSDIRSNAKIGEEAERACHKDVTPMKGGEHTIKHPGRLGKIFDLRENLTQQGGKG